MNEEDKAHRLDIEKEHVCKSCGKSYDSGETLYRDFGGEVGGITFCPHCKDEVN